MVTAAERCLTQTDGELNIVQQRQGRLQEGVARRIALGRIRQAMRATGAASRKAVARGLRRCAAWWHDLHTSRAKSFGFRAFSIARCGSGQFELLEP